MLLSNIDINEIIISTLDKSFLRLIILISCEFNDLYREKYKNYFIEKNNFILEIDTKIINLFGYDNLMNAPYYADLINQQHQQDNFSPISLESWIINKTNFKYNKIYPLLIGKDLNNRKYIILFTNFFKCKIGIDIIYENWNSTTIWKYYSNNGIIQYCEENTENTCVRSGCFLCNHKEPVYLDICEYDYKNIKNILKINSCDPLIIRSSQAPCKEINVNGYY